jgi:hypothetical protein
VTSPVTSPAPRLAPPPGRPHSCAHLQALDDAISYRAARLRAPCRTCRPGAPCPAHACDLRLLDTYHGMARTAVATIRATHSAEGQLTAEKRPSISPAAW